MPAQDLRMEVPADSSPVLIFNGVNNLLYPATGDILVQVDGSVLPTLGRNEYAQVVLAPGTNELVLGHWDLVRFTDTYTFEVETPMVYVRVRSRPQSTEFEKLKVSLDYIEERYTPVRVPDDWGADG
ncbi:MAG: hypothetical protein AAF624_06825 [Bacteroidota bacterium]